MGNQLTAVVLLVAIAGGSMYAAEKTHTVVYVSDVYVGNRDGSSELLGPGRVPTSGIFAKIGVHLRWHVGELPPVRSAADGAIKNVFGIRTLEHARGSATPDALASARIVGSWGTEIAIYKDHLQSFLDRHPSLAGAGAGYVLTHELAHVMQGIARHAEFGILKAQWSNDDFEDMIFHKLAFTDFDVDLIHQYAVSRWRR